MLATYYRRSKAGCRRNCVYRNKRNACTYASLLDASRRGGITVETSCAVCADASGVCHRTERPVYAEHGFLRYKDWWERKEADVFVNHQVLTGIPVLASPDTLRVVSGGSSFFVPLEQVACIRTADRLSTC